MFFTGSVSEIVPIVRLDTHAVGDGKPGPVTRRLQAALKDATANLATHA